MSVSLFVFLLITQNPLTDLPQILTDKLGRTTGIFNARFKHSNYDELTLVGKV